MAGCAGGGGVPSGDPPGSYAGYSEGEAISSASTILRSQLAEEGSPLFQKTLEVGELEKGTMADGSTRARIAHTRGLRHETVPVVPAHADAAPGTETAHPRCCVRQG